MSGRFVPSMLSVALVLSGCATESKDVVSSYVSPLQYQSFDCEQLAAEAQRIQGRVIELGGRLDQAAKNDKALVGVGLIVFWPAMLFIGGTKGQEAEYGRLKGEYEAVQHTAIGKKCQLAGVGTRSADAGAGAAPAVQRAEFKVTDGFTFVTRSVTVAGTDIARGALPGAGDIDSLRPPGGWLPVDAESRGRWSLTYELADGQANLTGRTGPREVVGTPAGPRSVIPVVYEGWVRRKVVYGDLQIDHRTVIKIWHSPELGLPVKFESSVVAGGNHNRDSKETLLLTAIN